MVLLLHGQQGLLVLLREDLQLGSKETGFIGSIDRTTTTTTTTTQHQVGCSIGPWGSVSILKTWEVPENNENIQNCVCLRLVFRKKSRHLSWKCVEILRPSQSLRVRVPCYVVLFHAIYVTHTHGLGKNLEVPPYPPNSFRSKPVVFRSKRLPPKKGPLSRFSAFVKRFRASGHFLFAVRSAPGPKPPPVGFGTPFDPLTSGQGCLSRDWAPFGPPPAIGSMPGVGGRLGGRRPPVHRVWDETGALVRGPGHLVLPFVRSPEVS